MLTYGVSELSSKKYGAFIRPRGVFGGYFSKGFYTGGDVDGVTEAHKNNIIKAMFLDIPINETLVDAIGDAAANKINIIDDSAGAIDLDLDDFAGTGGEVMVFYLLNSVNGFSVTDEASTPEVFQSTGDNQGVVCYNLDGDWYIYDVVFIPVGVAQEQVKIGTEKGEEVSDSYSNKLTTSYNANVETITMQVTKDNMDFLNGLAEAEVDFGVYTHSSLGNNDDNGMLIPSGAAIGDVPIGSGWMVKELNIVPKLLFAGNTQNTITLSASKEFGVSVSGIVGVQTYVTTA